MLAAYVVLRKNATRVSSILGASPPSPPLPPPPSLLPVPTPTQLTTPLPPLQAGKPYIVSNESRRVSNTASPLSEGFTIISQTVFANWEDANYYDKECPAHLELKKVTGPVRTGVQTIIYESDVGVEGVSAGAKL